MEEIKRKLEFYYQDARDDYHSIRKALEGSRTANAFLDNRLYIVKTRMDCAGFMLDLIEALSSGEDSKTNSPQTSFTFSIDVEDEEEAFNRFKSR